MKTELSFLKYLFQSVKTPQNNAEIFYKDNNEKQRKPLYQKTSFQAIERKTMQQGERCKLMKTSKMKHY